MDISAIRATIELAKRHEKNTGHLRRLLTQQLPFLHAAIHVPQSQSVAALEEFVAAYIDSAPDFLEAAEVIVREAHIEKHAQPLLQLAEDYFRKPSEVRGEIGLDELMNEAYLLHRVLEELNDRYRVHTGLPLLPADMDTTAANLIGHHLIGEPFANELDEVVHCSVEQILYRQSPCIVSADTGHIFDGDEEQRGSPRLRQPLSLSF